MKFSRLTLAAAVSAALVLSSCTGADDTAGGPTDGPSAPAGTTSAQQTEEPTGAGDAEETTDGATTTEDGAGTTAAAPGDDASQTTEMTTDPAVADLTVAEAEEIATTLLEARLETLKASDNKAFRAAREEVFRGSANQASTAEYQLRRVVGDPAGADAEEPAEPNVLAISRKDEDESALMLVQTVPDQDGVPLLHLMESPSGEIDDYRIIWEAPMLPGTTVATFASRSGGTPLLGDVQGDLRDRPRDLLKGIAQWISFPQPSDEDNPGVRTHGYVPAVRAAAREQAEAVSTQATLREKNWLETGDVRTLAFDDGTALVLGTLLRDTTFTVRPGSELTAPDTFKRFAGDATITDEAVLRTRVFIAVHAPSEDRNFKPEMLAAREQLVDAWGS